MKIHYFQRYHKGEDVATANTMLLLSRLYSYSSDKFFRLLKSEFFENTFDPEINFTLQAKSGKSVPDAVISQESFKIVVETKLTDWFYTDQLMRHLNAFEDEKHKILITLSSELMSTQKKQNTDAMIKEHNSSQKYHVRHINTTFEILIKAIREIIDDRDYEMQDVLDDFMDYCCNDGLISGADSWKYMRMQLAGATIDFNISENIYYDDASRGFRAHNYLGLYKNKSVRAIGKICARITAEVVGNEIIFEEEYGQLTEDRKNSIQKAISDGDTHGYDMRNTKHRYFFVEKFYETDFKKMTSGAAMGSRIFDLSQILDTNPLPPTEKIAELLNSKTWN